MIKDVSVVGSTDKVIYYSLIDNRWCLGREEKGVQPIMVLMIPPIQKDTTKSEIRELLSAVGLQYHDILSQLEEDLRTVVGKNVMDYVGKRG